MLVTGHMEYVTFSLLVQSPVKHEKNHVLIGIWHQTNYFDCGNRNKQWWYGQSANAKFLDFNSVSDRNISLEDWLGFELYNRQGCFDVCENRTTHFGDIFKAWLFWVCLLTENHVIGMNEWTPQTNGALYLTKNHQLRSFPNCGSCQDGLFCRDFYFVVSLLPNKFDVQCASPVTAVTQCVSFEGALNQWRSVHQPQ